MNIAIDIRSAEGRKAGKGVYTYNLIKNLIKIDKNNQYFLYCKNPDENSFNFPNVKLVKVKGSNIFWHLNAYFKIRKNKTDIFIATSSFIIPFLLPKKIKTLLSVHDLVAIKFPSKHLKKAVLIEKLLLKSVVKKAYKILAVSQNTKNDLIKLVDTIKNKIEIIYCGVSENFKTFNDYELKLAKNSNIVPDKYFLAVGTIEPRKNYLNLIYAFKLFLEKHPDFKLIVVGNKGWQYEKVFSEIKRLKLKERVVFPDYLPESGLLNLYNLSSALVFPSFYEGFGIPPLEAMKCSCPVIASNSSSIPEVVGNAGIYIDPNKTKDIAKKMTLIIEDKKLREDLIMKGLKNVNRFTWENSAKKLYEIIKNI